MAATVDLVERSGDLKRELLEFARKPRYDRAFQDVVSAKGVDLAVEGADRLISVLDYFVLQHRLRNRQTIVEEFVAARPDLPEPERAMLLGWRDVVEGVFEVEHVDGDELVLENLVDELAYRVRSNMGAEVFRHLRPGSFVVARLVPVGEGWLVSGTMQPWPRRARESVYAAAAELAMRQPRLVFRNPAKLARAWELQRAEGERFVRFFGSDMVVLAGAELADRMRAYAAFSRHAILAGMSEAEAARVARKPPVEFRFPTELLESEAVAVIYDRSEGLSFFAGFAEFERAFTDPSVLRRRHYRERVLAYLDDPTVSPLPFRRLAERDADRASEVIGRVVGRKNFRWQRDGETLMRHRKPWFFEQPPLPTTLPVSERLAPYVAS